MTSLIRRQFLALLVLALVATSCGSSTGETQTATDGSTTDETTQADTEATPAPTTAPLADPVPTSVPVPEDDPAAEEAIAGLDADSDDANGSNNGTAAPPPEPVEPAAGAQGFVRNRFNLDPDPAAIDCIVSESAGNDVLAAALTKASVSFGDVDDTELRALSYAVNGCVDTLGLGGWATQAVGPQGEVAETAPGCFAERFDDPAQGDLTFFTFAAVTYQFRVDQEGVPGLLDAFVTCAPISSLADFFASQAESQSGFTVEIDLDCLNAALDDEASTKFWSTLIDGSTTPLSVIEPYTDQCAAAPTEDPAEAAPTGSLPDDFVPWAGTGALASVAPAQRANLYSSAPPMTIDPAASYEAVMATGGGEVRIRLFADTAPLTVNNFVSLARDGFFDGTVFHRVLDEFMAQGGDPTGTGTGGPGYRFADEFENGPPLDRKGLLAMANSGPGTNGSQFFITFIPTDWLTGNHTVFGEVIAGQDIVDAIERRDPGAAASRGQVLTSVTIIEN